MRIKVKRLVPFYVEDALRNVSGGVDSFAPGCSDAEVNVTIGVHSVDKGKPARNERLLSEEFLYSERFPNMAFRSTSFVPKGRNEYTVDGEMTIRGKTLPLQLQAKYIREKEPAGGRYRFKFELRGSVSRLSYGL